MDCNVTLIEVSVSKPNTSEFNGEISLICIYVLYVAHPMHAYTHCMQTICMDLTTCAYLDAFTGVLIFS